MQQSVVISIPQMHYRRTPSPLVQMSIRFLLPQSNLCSLDVDIGIVTTQVTSRIVQIHMTRRWFIAITILLLAIFSQSWLPTLLDDLYKKAQRRGGNNGNLGEGSAADPSFDEERTLLALEQANHHTLVRQVS